MGSILNFISEFSESESVLENTLYNGINSNSFQSSALFDYICNNINSSDISITYNSECVDSGLNLFLLECQTELRDIILEISYILDIYDKFKNISNFKFLISSISEATPYIESFEDEFLKICKDENIDKNKFIFIDSNNNINNLKSLNYYEINHFIYDGAYYLKEISNDWFQNGVTALNELNYNPTIPTEIEAKSNKNRDYYFISLNRSNWKIHRTILGCYLLELSSGGNVLWSFLNKPNDVHKSNNSGKMDYYDESTEYLRRLFEKNIVRLESTWPKEIDTMNSENKYSFRTSDTFDKSISLSSYFDIVTESRFLDDELFFTEKIIKPIVNLHPFIVISTTGYLRTLKKLGFKTFDSIFDESYDTIEDSFERLEFIIKQIDSILSKPKEEIQKMYDDVFDICRYNRNLLYTKYSNKNEHIINILNKIRNEE